MVQNQGASNEMGEEGDEMDDMISREAALNCFHDWVDRRGDVHTPDEMAEYRALEALPSVQPDIIRCKDCVNWQTYWARVDAPDDHFCAVVDGFHDGDWYCADAKRDSGGADMRGTE